MLLCFFITHNYLYVIVSIIFFARTIVAITDNRPGTKDTKATVATEIVFIIGTFILIFPIFGIKQLIALFAFERLISLGAYWLIKKTTGYVRFKKVRQLKENGKLWYQG